MARKPEAALLFERYCALAAGVLAAVACWASWGQVRFPGSWKELLSAVFTACATGAGFLFTAASILMSMGEKPIVKWGRETGAYEMFAGYLMRGVCWCLIAAMGTLLMFMPDFTKTAEWHRAVFSAWVAMISGATVAVARVLVLLSIILRAASQDEER